MRLTTDQQEALLQLQRVQLRCDEAEVERSRQIERCWGLGLPARRIAQAANVTTNVILRICQEWNRT